MTTTELKFFDIGNFRRSTQHKKALQHFVALLLLLCCLAPEALAKHHKKAENTDGAPVLWTDPGNISARDLFYGEGGKEHLPAEGPLSFQKEDLDGTSPKFDARDSADK